MTNNFLCLLSINRKFPWYICNSLSRRKKRFRAHNYSASVSEGGNCKFCGVGGFSPTSTYGFQMMPGINRERFQLIERYLLSGAACRRLAAPCVVLRCVACGTGTEDFVCGTHVPVAIPPTLMQCSSFSARTYTLTNFFIVWSSVCHVV